MVRKYEDLVKFGKELLDMGYDEINTENLHILIGKKFGISKYVRVNIHKSLVDFKILLPTENFQIWKINKEFILKELSEMK